MIFNIKTMNTKLLALCLLIISLASCRKEEFQPEAEGAPIPVEEIKTTLKEAVNASTNTLFKAAWNRSNMNSIVDKRGANSTVTVLMPTDAAFIAEGLTLEVINRTTPALLDSILLYHTVGLATDAEALSNRGDNAVFSTLLENPYLKSRAFENYNYDKYFYRQYLKVTNNELFINGRKSGGVNTTRAKNGTLWPIDHVLHKPTKTILQALQEDGRFGMYLGIMNHVDMLWMEATFEISYRRYFTEGITLSDNPQSLSYIINFTSVFAPTDDAFRAAGFNSIDDLMALNNRNTLPYLDWDTFEIVGSGYATDTLLTMHRWGRLFKGKDNFGEGVDNPDAFYSNDLNNQVLSDYALSGSGYSGSIPILYVPFDFGTNSSGKVTVKVKGSDKPAATVTEADINTLMGPIHVVDRLLTPANFKY